MEDAAGQARASVSSTPGSADYCALLRGTELSFIHSSTLCDTVRCRRRLLVGGGYRSNRRTGKLVQSPPKWILSFCPISVDLMHHEGQSQNPGPPCFELQFADSKRTSAYFTQFHCAIGCIYFFFAGKILRCTTQDDLSGGFRWPSSRYGVYHSEYSSLFP